MSHRVIISAVSWLAAAICVAAVSGIAYFFTLGSHLTYVEALAILYGYFLLDSLASSIKNGVA